MPGRLVTGVLLGTWVYGTTGGPDYGVECPDQLERVPDSFRRCLYILIVLCINDDLDYDVLTR